jgi:ABC-type dipeptide/oligopeptide/nickel transport system permease subunit
VLPIITLWLVITASESRFQRAAMLEVINSDYIRTGRAKGLPRRTVILEHGLRNALIPLATIWAIDFVLLLGGAVVTETIFAWPGLGRLLLAGIFQQDLNLTMGVVMFLAILVVIFNLITDLLYGVLDPRSRSAASPRERSQGGGPRRCRGGDGHGRAPRGHADRRRERPHRRARGHHLLVPQLRASDLGPLQAPPASRWWPPWSSCSSPSRSWRVPGSRPGASDRSTRRPSAAARPSLEHPFGTDHIGRDLMARTFQGGRFSLRIAGDGALLRSLRRLPMMAVGEGWDRSCRSVPRHERRACRAHTSDPLTVELHPRGGDGRGAGSQAATLAPFGSSLS